MAHGVEMQDLAEVTANVLEAEKREFANSQAKFQADFEAQEAKFNADLEALATSTANSPEKLEAAPSWLLARKCWAWLRRD